MCVVNDKMEDFGRFESIGCFVDDEDNSSDGTRTSSPDGYASGGNAGGRALTDRRRRGHLDSEHKKRRAIANSNERKRMQSINAGFNSLRNLVCPKSGNKLSKAAILKYTADFIKSLLAEKQRLLANNRLLEQVLGGADLDKEGRNRHLLSPTCSPLRPEKRRWREMESTSSDEGIGFTAAEEILVTSSSNNNANSRSVSELHQQIKDLEEEVEKEKALRQLIEADKKELELRQLPLSNQQEMLLLLPDSSSARQTSAETQLPDLHNQAWRRGLETIVEAIRHVEGEQGMFGSGDVSTGLSNTGCSQQKRRSGRIESSSSSLHSQFHPVRIRDLSGGVLSSVPNQISFTSSFHRPSLAASSS